MRIPLSIKISIGAVVAVLVVVSFLLFNAYSYLVTDQLDELKQEVHVDISRLQQTIEFLLQRNELEQVQVELSSLGSISHMNHAFLVDENKNIIAASRLAYISKNVQDTFDEHVDDDSLARFSVSSSDYRSKLWISDDATTLYAVYPVVLGLETGEQLIQSRVGFIGAHVDLQWITSNVAETLQLKAVPMVVMLAAMAVLFALFHNYILVRRITNINRTAQEFATSGYKLRAKVEGNDEISDLAIGFNEMAEKVEKQNQGLIENEENISLIINSMEDGVITMNEKAEVCSFNKSAEKMFGYSNEEIIGKNVNTLMPEPYKSQHDDILKNYLKTGEKHVIGRGRDVPAQHKDGHIFSIHLSVNELPRSESGERLFIGSCLDITILKEQEKQLRQSQKMDALGKLTGGIAHDYNNMLGVILGYSELLKEKLSDDPKLKKFITEIHHAGQRGAQLTQKLLAFSRQKTASPDVTNINALLENNRNMLEKTLTARIQLICELDFGLWPVFLDKNDLEDSILNMCINAMHAIEHSGRLVLSTKNLHLTENNIANLQLSINPGDYVCLSICDTGAGIEEEVMTRIFDPFFSTKGDQGNGLGLSQVYGFVNRSLGAIKVESEINQGTCFKLFFPRYIGESEVIESLPAPVNEGSGSETILIVDDEPSLRALLSEMLSSKGYSTLLAENAGQAIETLENNKVDLMLSDIIMPGMNGYKLAEYVHRNHPDVKVQLASGYSDNSHNVEQYELHANILRKPFQRQVLLTRIREVLDSSEETSNNYIESAIKSHVGIKRIDDDHATISELVKQCLSLVDTEADSEALDSLIKELAEFTQIHFSRDEVLLKVCKHANLKQYRSTHALLLQELQKKYARFKAGELDAGDFKEFLNEWMRDHLIDLDGNMLMSVTEDQKEEIEIALSELE